MKRTVIRAAALLCLALSGAEGAMAQFYPAPPPPYGYYPEPPPYGAPPPRRYLPPPPPRGVPPAIADICYTRWMSCRTRPKLVNAPCSCFTPDGRALRGQVGF